MFFGLGSAWVLNYLSTNIADLQRWQVEWSFEKNGAPLLMWLFLGLYAFLEEFMARGILQSSLQKFLNDAKGHKSVLLNACFLFVLLFPLGFARAAMAFILAIPMGCIYAQQKSLLGVFLMHFILLVLGLIKMI